MVFKHPTFIFRAETTKREIALEKARSNSFAIALADRYLRFYSRKIARSNSQDRACLFKLMPSFDDVLIRADCKLQKFRYIQGKRRSARAARGKRFRIGPFIGPGMPSGSVRVYRTIDGFVEDWARSRPGRAKQVWPDLKPAFMTISRSVELFPDPKDFRREFYLLEIEGQFIRLQYGHFEKLFTRSRKPIKTLHELLSRRKVPDRRR